MQPVKKINIFILSFTLALVFTQSLGAESDIEWVDASLDTKPCDDYTSLVPHYVSGYVEPSAIYDSARAQVNLAKLIVSSLGFTTADPLNFNKVGPRYVSQSVNTAFFLLAALQYSTSSDVSSVVNLLVGRTRDFFDYLHEHTVTDYYLNPSNVSQNLVASETVLNDCKQITQADVPSEDTLKGAAKSAVVAAALALGCSMDEAHSIGAFLDMLPCQGVRLYLPSGPEELDDILNYNNGTFSIPSSRPYSEQEHFLYGSGLTPLGPEQLERGLRFYFDDLQESYIPMERGTLLGEFWSYTSGHGPNRLKKLTSMGANTAKFYYGWKRVNQIEGDTYKNEQGVEVPAWVAAKEGSKILPAAGLMLLNRVFAFADSVLKLIDLNDRKSLSKAELERLTETGHICESYLANIGSLMDDLHQCQASAKTVRDYDTILLNAFAPWVSPSDEYSDSPSSRKDLECERLDGALDTLRRHLSICEKTQQALSAPVSIVEENLANTQWGLGTGSVVFGDASVRMSSALTKNGLRLLRYYELASPAFVKKIGAWVNPLEALSPAISLPLSLLEFNFHIRNAFQDSSLGVALNELPLDTFDPELREAMNTLINDRDTEGIWVDTGIEVIRSLRNIFAIIVSWGLVDVLGHLMGHSDAVIAQGYTTNIQRIWLTTLLNAVSSYFYRFYQYEKDLNHQEDLGEWMLAMRRALGRETEYSSVYDHERSVVEKGFALEGHSPSEAEINYTVLNRVLAYLASHDSNYSLYIILDRARTGDPGAQSVLNVLVQEGVLSEAQLNNILSTPPDRSINFLLHRGQDPHYVAEFLQSNLNMTEPDSRAAIKASRAGKKAIGKTNALEDYVIANLVRKLRLP